MGDTIVSHKKLLMVLFLTGIVIPYQNCGGVQFTAAPPPTPSCILTNNPNYENLKIIFMVDNSDSTVTTDPNKYYRDTVISNFLTQYGSQKNLEYSFGYFAPTAYAWDASTGVDAFVLSNYSSRQGPLQPFGVATDLSSALMGFIPLPTAGGTAYQAAFNSINQTIVPDLKANNPWNYAVVFMSDGMPTDLGKSTQQVGAITALVQNLLNEVQASGTQITVSSVYFGPESSPQPITNLTAMASVGGGQFVDTNVNPDLEISDIVNIPGCQSQ